MKSLLFILNPTAGGGTASELEDILEKSMDSYDLDYEIVLTSRAKEAIEIAANSDKEYIVAVGGDGTINEVANGIAKTGNKIPVALFPSGTVNDFAKVMQIPRSVDEFVNMVDKGNYLDVDIGKLNDGYFLNVAAGGLLTHVGYQVDVTAKYLLGPLAYYLEGAKELLLQGIDPIYMEFQSDEYNYKGKTMLFLISNSSSIGGFENAMPGADVTDGYLDVIVLEDSILPDLAGVLVSAINGNHINHPKVKNFKTKKIQILSDKEVTVDIDGEYGGNLPAEISVSSNKLRLIVP